MNWDQDKIIRALLDRKVQGLALNTGAIQKSDRALAGAIQKHFRSHDAALRAAGIDPASVRKAFPWDQARVVAALRARAAAGLGLSHKVIVEEDMPLSGGIARCFGSLDPALRAAGIDPASARQRVRRWDPADIVAALRDRQARGLALNSKAVYGSDLSLYAAACSHFESYGAALQAAGVDAEAVRLRGPDWDRARIVAALLQRKDAGLDLNHNAVMATDSSLGYAMRDHFGSYDAALTAAGIDPAAVRKQTAWDVARILAALRDRQAKGLALSVSGVAASDLRLSGAICRYFPSHDAALRAAGIDPASARVRMPLPTGDEIFASLRAIAEGGEVSPAMAKSKNRRLLYCARRRFGTFEAAVRAAGLAYVVRRGTATRSPGHWTGEMVLQTLRDLHGDGHDLRYRPMKERRQPLFFAARQFFGSYVNAVRQAGIDYWQMSQAQLAKQRAACAGGEEDGPEGEGDGAGP